MHFPTGKLDPIPVPGLGLISDYEKTTAAGLIIPPSVTPINGKWTMDGNGPDKAVTNQGSNFQGVGNCTIVGARNADVTWNVLVNEHSPEPSANQCVSTYFAMSGGEDTGLAETAVLRTWMKKGLFRRGVLKLFTSSKILAFAPVDHTNINAILASIANYGGCYFGVQLPESAQDQFNQGGTSTWTVISGSPIDGGHCIWAVGYDATYVYIVTWGQIVAVEHAWLAKYLDEAYAIIPQQFQAAGKGPTLDLATLQADLAEA